MFFGPLVRSLTNPKNAAIASRVKTMNSRRSLAVIAAALLLTSAGWVGDASPAGLTPIALAETRLLLGGAALLLRIGPRPAWSAMQGLPSRSLLLAALAMAVFQWGFFVAVGALGSGTVIPLTTAIGPVAAIASGIAYAVYAAVTAEGNRAPKAGPRGLVTTGGALTGAGVLLAPVALRSSWPATTARSLATLLYLGCVAAALAYALFASGLRALTADRALG